jgi:hypothetical protein
VAAARPKEEVTPQPATVEKKPSGKKKVPTPPAQPGQKEAKKAEAVPSMKSAPGLPPLEAPPPVVSAYKEQRLQELLQLYKEDKITPDEYHTQRAKILAGP